MPYVKIARVDHYIKNIFVLPGILLAFLILDLNFSYSYLSKIILGLCAILLVSSSNYVINEFLDRYEDSKHPYKKKRILITSDVNSNIIYAEYILLFVVALIIGFYINKSFIFFLTLFFISGVIYNINPIRTKKRIYIDSLTESLNNPIRLLLGWSIIDSSSIPPLSLILGYYFLGTFLMNSKRLSEYNYFKNKKQLDLLVNYRSSFKYYTSNKLIMLSTIYSSMSLVFLTIFLTKYKIELLLFIPIVILLMVYYDSLSLQGKLVTANPEMLFKEKNVILLSLIATILFLLLIYYKIPILNDLLGSEPLNPINLDSIFK